MKLELKGITKKFGNFVANDSIDVVFEPGKVHCLLGENGAGKSTLMNILYGLCKPTSGSIIVNNQEVSFNGPGDAMRRGIGMVHQHFMLIPVFTVAENVALGHEHISKYGILDLNITKKEIKNTSSKYGISINADDVVGSLPVGIQQRVEIIKALKNKTEVLILDEPTAVLTPQETDELLEIIRQLKSDGTSIILITHKLREVKEIADEISVIRRGKIVGTASPNDSTSRLAELMVGRNVNLNIEKSLPNPGKKTFSVRKLSAIEDNGLQSLEDINFDVREGEILAIAGVQGNGQTELAEAILGLKKNITGSIVLNKQELIGKSVKQILDYGVGFVPEDRTTKGLIKDFSITENLVLDLYDKKPYSNGINLNLGFIKDNAVKAVKNFDIRTSSIHKLAKSLSGGNQQKIVLSRELARNLKLFIAAQPTRGLDVGSIEFIHKRIIEERNKKVPVIIISSELDEVYQLADKIAVMYKGRIVGIVSPQTPKNILGLMMTGLTPEEAEEKINSYRGA